MPTTYDPEVLQKYADDLYWKARKLVAERATVWGVIGFVVAAGYTAFVLRGGDAAAPAIIFGSLSGLLFGAIAAQIAKSQAFKYRLEAQQTLCQVSIENHLREAKKPDAAMSANA